MAWSIFQQGGGQGAAVTWAKDLLSGLGAPQSPANVQFIYDWEVSEGGGGAYNPLNQGPVPGQPQLTTTGQQYGGGAADFASWQAGLTGAEDYLHMSAYSGVLAGLKSGSYSQAEQALWASPWASSHYGYGSNWSTSPAPGASQLAPGGGSIGANTTSSVGSALSGLLGGGFGSLVTDGINAVLSALGLGSLKDLFERLGLIILGFALVILGIHILASGTGKQAINITTESSEGPEGSTSSRKIKTPVSQHTKTTTTRAAKGAGAEEALEAAGVA